MCLQKKSTTQNIRCPACTNPPCNTWITREIRSEQEKRKWERSRSNLRENKESDMVRDTWRETQMSSYLCHVLLALLCTDHSLNHLLYFGNKTLTQCFALGCMTVFAALLHCSTYKSSCYFLDTEIQGLEIQIHNEAAWLLANKPLVVICISVIWFFFQTCNPSPNCAQQHTRLCQMGYNFFTVCSFCY